MQQHQHQQQQHQGQRGLQGIQYSIPSDLQDQLQQFDAIHGFLDNDPRSAMPQAQHQHQQPHQRMMYQQQHHPHLPVIQGYQQQQAASSAYLLSTSAPPSQLPIKNRSRHHSVTTTNGQTQFAPHLQQHQFLQSGQQTNESIQRERLQQLENELEEYAQELADEKRLQFQQHKNLQSQAENDMDEDGDEDHDGDADIGDEDGDMNSVSRRGARSESGTTGTGGNNTPRHSASPSPSSPSLTYSESFPSSASMGFLPSASPSSFTPPPPVLSEKARQEAEDDKRRRNTAASARFRHKKRLREQILEKTAQEMTAKSDRLQVRVRELEMEIKWLRGLVVEKDSKGTLKRSLGVTLGIASPTGGAMSAGTGSVGGIGINIPGGGGPNISLPMAHSNLLSSSLPASLAMPPSPFGSPTSFIPGAHYPFGVDNNGSSGSSFTSHSTVSPSALVNQGGGHGVKAESASGTKASSRRSKKAQ